METPTYAVDGAVARITLNRPERGNGLTLLTPRELSACVEKANLDRRVHVIALGGNGKVGGGGDDLQASAEGGNRASPPRRAPWTRRCSAEVRGRDEPFGDAGPSTFKG